MKRTKLGKGAGVGEVCPELSRADMEDTVIRLTSCYNRLWAESVKERPFRQGIQER